MAEVQNTVVIPPPRTDTPLTNGPQFSSTIPVMSPESYKFLEQILSSDKLFIAVLTRYLYCAQLVKTNIADPDSPLEGYKLVKIGGDKWKPNMNLQGFQTTMNQVLFDGSAAVSTAKLTKDLIDVRRAVYRNTLSLANMMASNRESWEFKNYTLIRPFCHAVFLNITSIASRSIADGKIPIIDRILHPNMWNSMKPEQNENMGGQKSWLRL